MMIESDDFKELDNQMEELASQVEEHFPKNPNRAYEHFCHTFPEVIAGTVVSLVWAFLEYRLNQKYAHLSTRPLQPEDISIFSTPNIFN